MKKLESSKEKIQYICDQIRQETLEPAEEEARQIVAKAQSDAEAIIKKAEENAEKLVHSARECIERERSVFQSSLSQACKQGIENLRQDIETRLFNSELTRLVVNGISDHELVSELVKALIKAVEKEGLGTDISVLVGQKVAVRELNTILGEKILKKVRNEEVEVGNFSAGAKLKIHEQNVTIDMSDGALVELLASYLRKDFRELLYQN